VRDIGGWIGGKWVFEMSRVLQTEQADGIPFDKGRRYAFIANLFQGKGKLNPRGLRFWHVAGRFQSQEGELKEG